MTNQQQQSRFLPAEFFKARTQRGTGLVPNNPMNIAPYEFSDMNSPTLYGDTSIKRPAVGVKFAGEPQQTPSAAGRGLTADTEMEGDRLDRTTQIALAGSGQRPVGDGRKPIDEMNDSRRGGRRRPGINTSFASGINRGRWGRSA